MTVLCDTVMHASDVSVHVLIKTVISFLSHSCELHNDALFQMLIAVHCQFRCKMASTSFGMDFNFYHDELLMVLCSCKVEPLMKEPTSFKTPFWNVTRLKRHPFETFPCICPCKCPLTKVHLCVRTTSAWSSCGLERAVSLHWNAETGKALESGKLDQSCVF